MQPMLETLALNNTLKKKVGHAKHIVQQLAFLPQILTKSSLKPYQ